jgi:hypothetical protein
MRKITSNDIDCPDVIGLKNLLSDVLLSQKAGHNRREICMLLSEKEYCAGRDFGRSHVMSAKFAGERGTVCKQ